MSGMTGGGVRGVGSPQGSRALMVRCAAESLPELLIAAPHSNMHRPRGCEYII